MEGRGVDEELGVKKAHVPTSSVVMAMPWKSHARGSDISVLQPVVDSVYVQMWGVVSPVSINRSTLPRTEKVHLIISKRTYMVRTGSCT